MKGKLLAPAPELRRYTDVLNLLEIVRTRRLPLSVPDFWQDSTDRLCLQVYADRFRLQGEGDRSIFALCMTQTSETSHHWQLYASHSHGVCIVFDRAKLCAAIEEAARRSPSIRHGQVEYLDYSDMKEACDCDPDKLPFVKRKEFADEREYRVIAVSGSELFDGEFSIPIPLSAINRIVLGYRMPTHLSQGLSDLVRSFRGCRDLVVRQSTFMDNGKWRRGLNAMHKRLRKTPL
jgi:hypothetical protein